MKCDANRLFVATAGAFAIIWIICSALVAILPGQMLGMSGHMIHADFAAMSWTLTWAGFVIGLVAWSVSAGITAWLIGTIYNKLLG